jgi:hypothetical protein
MNMDLSHCRKDCKRVRSMDNSKDSSNVKE